MIYSKNGKSYDASDGSEQPHAASARPAAERSERSDIDRWEDDGPGPHARAPRGDPPRKPAWSVLSLQGLKELIRLVGRSDAPAQVRQQAERAERERAAAEHERADKAAAAATARRDRHRNAWENT